MTSPLVAAFIGLLSGTHAATWGMYKDAPHEGFTWRTYLRSVALGIAIAVAAAGVARLDPTWAADAVLLFGLAYAVERAVAEIYKTFLREQDQGKYTIPMQFAVGGRIVRHRGVRALLGVAYGALMLAVLAVVAGYQRRLGGPPPLGAVLLLGAAGGWISAFGGAWKDAPVEGFQIRKFFRSPAIAAGFALLLSRLTDDLTIVAVAATGYTIATTETYKTFFFPSVPRGKFVGKPIRHPEMLRRRQRFVPLYVAIWVAVLATFGCALAA